jgi:hypothetical protein
MRRDLLQKVISMRRRTENSSSSGPPVERWITGLPNNHVAPMRGSPEWTARATELIQRDRLEDFDELCRLMGAEKTSVAAVVRTRLKLV